MMRLGALGLPADRVLRAVRSLDKACLQLCEGQYMDLEFQDQMMVTSVSFLDMVSRKAGALVGSAAEAGAPAADADENQCQALHVLGVKLVTAWQIARDIDDFWGERGDAVTASNIIARKKSLPVVHALENGSVAAKRELGSIYMKRVLEAEDAARLVTILNETGSRDAAELRSRHLADEGLSAAMSAGVSEDGMGALRELAEWALSGGP